MASAGEYADLAAADAKRPCERIDGTTPANDRYNASAGALLGIGMPADMFTVSVTAAPTVSDRHEGD